MYVCVYSVSNTPFLLIGARSKSVGRRASEDWRRLAIYIYVHMCIYIYAYMYVCVYSVSNTPFPLIGARSKSVGRRASEDWRRLVIRGGGGPSHASRLDRIFSTCGLM